MAEFNYLTFRVDCANEKEVQQIAKYLKRKNVLSIKSSKYKSTRSRDTREEIILQNLNFKWIRGGDLYKKISSYSYRTFQRDMAGLVMKGYIESKFCKKRNRCSYRLIYGGKNNVKCK